MTRGVSRILFPQGITDKRGQDIITKERIVLASAPMPPMRAFFFRGMKKHTISNLI